MRANDRSHMCISAGHGHRTPELTFTSVGLLVATLGMLELGIGHNRPGTGRARESYDFTLFLR